MATTYEDFIPEDQDPGALGGGYADFVPAKEPVKPEPKTDGEPRPRDEKGHFVK